MSGSFDAAFARNNLLTGCEKHIVQRQLCFPVSAKASGKADEAVYRRAAAERRLLAQPLHRPVQLLPQLGELLP
ncbi:hypothetical protein [Treponema endosymbiont of Eucomonympha sp.]|uniref:hypothetical protein n=1 Tax=Treponema endosymbiont of Eucomonympha sp. TaxID=1580831 RepID=UPI00075161A7|nr:hypothetical protein [Treponema endosymbiont of Eucomonympha sp.]